MGFSNIFQASCRYVDSVGEHFTHMLHEVDGLFTPDVCVKKPVSIISLENKAENSCDENALDDKLSACAKMESVLSDEFADETISNLFSEHNVENKSSACAKMEPVLSNVIFDERASNLYMEHNVEGYKESSTGPDENHLNDKMSESIVSDGFVGDPVSNLSPVHNVEDKKSSTGPDENALVDKMLESILSDGFVGDIVSNLSPVHNVEDKFSACPEMNSDVISNGFIDGPISDLSSEHKIENTLLTCAEMESVVICDGFADETIPNLFSERNIEDMSSCCAKMESDYSDGYADGPISNLSSEHSFEDYRELRARADENTLDEKGSACVKLDSAVGDPVSSGEYESMASVGKNQDLVLAEAIKFNIPDGAGEIHTSESLNDDSTERDCGIASATNVSGNYKSKDPISGLTLPTSIYDDAVTEKYGAQEPISLVGFPEKEHEQQIEPNKLKAYLQLPEIETPDGCDREGVLDGLDVLNPIIEQIKAFEDIELDDCEGNHDIENYELTLISYRASRNTLYKERLRNTLISKVRSSMGRSRRRLNSFYHGAVSLSSSNDLYQKLLIQDSTESEWELV